MKQKLLNYYIEKYLNYNYSKLEKNCKLKFMETWNESANQVSDFLLKIRDTIKLRIGNIP